MFRITRILIAIITTATTIVGNTNPAPTTEPEAEPTTSTITLHDTDPRWIDDITDDLARFSDAGLDSFAVDVQG